MSKKSTIFADVAPAIPLPSSSKQQFTYQLSPVAQNIKRYQQVTVPFSHRSVQGVVVRIHTKRPPYKTKEIVRARPAILTAKQVAFAHWLQTTLHGGLGFTFRLFYPPGQKKGSNPNFNDTHRLSQKKNIIPEHSILIHTDRIERHGRLLPLYRKVIQRKQQVLVITPERWIAEEVHTLIAKHIDSAIVYHAGQSVARQTNTWHTVHTGHPQIIIGTHKSIFLPHTNLGLIVVEEDGFSSHKQWDQYPKLDNRRAAQLLAEIHEVNIVTSTSWPSVNTFALHTESMPRKLPGFGRVHCIPHSFEDKLQHRIIPEEFIKKLRSWQKQKQKVLLLYNRKGTWQWSICRTCKHVPRCEECGIAQTVHDGKHICHHCKIAVKIPDKCSQCHKGTYRTSGFGINRLAEVITQTTGHTPHVLEAGETYNSLAPITLATSAIFTAAHTQTFEKIAWLYPERDLLYPDYRSTERARLILQRLGQQKTNQQSTLILVTRQQRLIEKSLLTPSEKFFEREVRNRKHLGYTSNSANILLTFSGVSEKASRQSAVRARREISRRLKKHDMSRVIVRGPYQSFKKKHRGKSEQHILLTGPLNELPSLYKDMPVTAVELDPQRIV